MIVDESMQSLLDYGTPDYPFAYYRDEAERLAENSISWHWHNSFEFSYVSKGSLICDVFGEEIQLSQGDAVFINSGVLHHFVIHDASVLENILFAPEFIAQKESRVYLTCVLPYLRSDLQHCVFRSQEAKDSKVIERIADCCEAACVQTMNTKSEIGVLAKVLALWNDFVPYCEPGEESESAYLFSLTQSRARKMLYYIYTHYHEKISLKDIAESAGISQREALRCFSEAIHHSPVSFLNTHRLKCAEQLLRTSHKAVSDIALETGFDNAGYFCKCFRKTFGISPLQYRKLQRHTGC